MSFPNAQRRRVLLAGAAGLVSSLALAGCGNREQFTATDISGSNLGQGWQLPDTNGTMRSAADFTGKVAVFFFGFIQCPDVCPTTLAELAQVRAMLGEDGDRLQVLFATVDPERDTPEIVEDYVSRFDPSFIGLRGEPEQLVATARSFKAFYAKVPTASGGTYTMDHSTGMYLFGTDGTIQRYARYGQPVEALAEDVRLLLA